MIGSLLLDTCTILWVLNSDSRIIKNDTLLNRLNTRRRFFSSISIAEIEIKKSMGRLKIPDHYYSLILESGIEEIHFTGDDALILGSLPFHHKDPFDRMIISTAINNRLTVITSDEIFERYKIDVIKA